MGNDFLLVVVFFWLVAVCIWFFSQAFAEMGVDEVGVKGVVIDPISDKALTQTELEAGYLINVTGYIGFLLAINNGGNPTNLKLTLLKIEIQKDLGLGKRFQF